MPISTPENWLIHYSNDKDHFEHVLEHLLIPSLEKVDLEPISPITKGSELIHGEIIKNIEIADLVICDMSTLNPNVFFELGIRTALNKPICLIKDDVTPKIPFDTSIINNHEYLSALNPWTLDEEINAIANHIEESLKRNEDTNSLWKYFSLSSTAHPVEPEKGIDGRIDFLTMQIEALRNQLMPRKKMAEEMVLSIYKLADRDGVDIEKLQVDEDIVKIYVKEEPPRKFIHSIVNIGIKHGNKIEIVDLSENLIFNFE
jgi:hypothetical protein